MPDSPSTPSICRIDGCDRPGVILFSNKPNSLCARHTCEMIAGWMEEEQEGDTIQDIHKREQVGAWIRGLK